MAQISVIIPSLGRGADLVRCAADLAIQTVSDFEVIVILQRPISAAECAAIREALGVRLRLFFSPEPNASLARNIGLLEAKSHIALFLDDDIQIPSVDFLGQHLRHYADPATSGVYGQVLELGQRETMSPSLSAIESDWGWINLPANYGRPCRTRNGGSGNLSVRREWALAVGGMDSWFQRGARREETEFNLRYTKRYGYLVFDPRAGIIHLSSGEGGSRTWGRVIDRVPMHHITGHWYFLLSCIVERTLGVRGVLNELRYIAVALIRNPAGGQTVSGWSRNAGRGLFGFCVAASRRARGPRRVDTLDRSSYVFLEV